MNHLKKYFPFIWYYVGWFGCVYLGRYNLAEWSLFFPLVLIALQASWGQLKPRLAVVLVSAGLLGIVFDSLLMFQGWITFTDHNSSILPLWLVSIWILFVFILPGMVPFFYSRLKWAALLGAVFGPLSYLSGQAMKVMAFENPMAIYLYAIFWGLYFPAVIYLIGKTAGDVAQIGPVRKR